MKKVFITALFSLILCATSAIAASESDAVMKFFDSFVQASNTYDKSMENYFLPNTKIERVVIKPDKTKASLVIPMSEYKAQLKKGAVVAKAVKYRNAFKDRKITKVGSDYKITALRYANADKVGLPCYYVITKIGKDYKIKTESWETKQQGFLKYIKE